jgi:serine protease Do
MLVGTSVADDGMDIRTAELRESVRQMIATARDRVFPALVNIEVVTVNYWGGQERKGGSVGSGTIISPEGYVVTNYHVTDNGTEFTCRLADKREVSAELIGEDPLTDIAILKIDLDELREGETLPVAEWGDSQEVQVGDYVMAMGSPLALSRSVTLGIVSNTERVFVSAGGGETQEYELGEGERTGLFTRWIQHDALIHPGNSGGPLVNLEGKIIGVNELGGAGQGFAIPSNLAREVAVILIEEGEVTRSWVGVALRSLKDTGFDRGVLINSVVSNSPADKAGLEPGDVLLEINGEPVTVRFAEELPPLMKRIASQPVGATVPLTYLRDDEEHETELVTAKLRRDVGEEEAFRGWGLTGMEITEKMARDRRLDDSDGVLISGVRSGGPANLAEPSLQFGDVIRAVDGEPVLTLKGLVQQYREIMDQDPLPEYLLIEFDRSGKNHVTLIEPRPDKTEDPPRELPKAWIGIATQPVVKQLAEKINIGDMTGFRVTRVYPRTEVAETELQVGDVIIKLNDADAQPQRIEDAGMLSRMVRQLDIGDTATLTILRDGELKEVEVLLERSRIEPQEARRDRNQDFELTVRELTFFDRDDRNLDEDVKGVVVESVERAGWASRAGVRSGDLLLRVNDFEITGLPVYRRVMEIIAEREPERVVFVVLRGVETRFLFVEPDWDPELDEAEVATTE